MGEFFRQGDLEKQKLLSVSPLCNRDTTSKPLSQINFIEFIVAPLYYHVRKYNINDKYFNIVSNSYTYIYIDVLNFAIYLVNSYY